MLLAAGFAGITVIEEVWPGGTTAGAVVCGLMLGFDRVLVADALNVAAARAARAPVSSRPPVQVTGPRRPVDVTIARAIQARVAPWLIVAGLMVTMAVWNTWRYRFTDSVDLIMAGILTGLPTLVAWMIHRTLRRRARLLDASAVTAVVVVGFTDPFARGLVLQPVACGPRLALTMTWKWRPDVSPGDVLTWVGPWQADHPFRAAWQAKQVPLWVLCCPRRDYLVSTSRAFDLPDPAPTTGSANPPERASRQRIPGVLTREDVDARDGKARH